MPEESSRPGLCSDWIRTTLIRMEHTATQTPTVSQAVRTAINETVGSVRAAAIQAGIPHTTLHRRLLGDGTDFTVGELHKLAAITGRTTADLQAGAR